MTCRHRPGDYGCSKTNPGLYTAPEPTTPDKKNFTIVDAVEVGKYLVLKVQYPNCRSCAFEGTKVLVYFDRKYRDVLFWKEIDPHFRDPKFLLKPDEAPSPIARFPASNEGWADALAYANLKAQQ